MYLYINSSLYSPHQSSASRLTASPQGEALGALSRRRKKAACRVMLAGCFRIIRYIFEYN